MKYNYEAGINGRLARWLDGKGCLGDKKQEPRPSWGGLLMREEIDGNEAQARGCVGVLEH